MLVGFGLIIIGFFYIFIKLIHQKDYNNRELRFKILSENFYKSILIIFMSILFIIPSISYTESIMDWNQIEFLNFLKAFIFIIGCVFIPGACLFNIFFLNNRIHKMFDVNPIIIKITLYPLLSFTYMGLLTLILDVLGLNKEFFKFVLFLSIIFLYFLDILHQKKKNNKIVFKYINVKISRNTIFLLFLMFGTIIIAYGIHSSVNYLIPFDFWRSINYASQIGTPGSNIWDNYCGFYAIYWGYISFGFSQLCGIPYINVNVLFIPFVYLYVTSAYLLIKSLLKKFNDIYSILSTIFVITFSGLFYIFNSDFIISPLTGQGLLLFSFRSFAFYTSITSMALFIILAKTKNYDRYKFKLSSEDIKVLILIAIFLLQALFTYILPIIPTLLLIMAYCLLSRNKNQNLKFLNRTILLFTTFFIFFDIFSSYFFSWQITRFIFSFFMSYDLIRQKYLLINALIIYVILVIFVIISYLVRKIYIKFYAKRFKKYYNFKINIIFILFSIIFSFLLILEVYFNFLLKNNQNFFLFYLDSIFLNIGIIGILGIYLSNLLYKKDKKTFYILIFWMTSLFILSSLIIFEKWLKYPFMNPQELESEEIYIMMYWFDRNWYYSIFPLSIFSAIGIISMVKFFNKKRIISKIKKSYSFIICSILIFFSISNTIYYGIFIYNIEFKASNEQAQMFGWISENVPIGSKILSDYYDDRILEDIVYCKGYTHYYINSEIYDVLGNYGLQYYVNDCEGWIISYNFDYNCSIGFLEDFYDSGFILNFNDQNNNGSALVKIILNQTQESGDISFSIKNLDVSKKFHIEFLSQDNNVGFLITIDSNSIFSYNGSIYQEILEIESDVWYSIKVKFECSNGNYSGLEKYTWNLFINNTDYGNFFYRNNITQINTLRFYSDLDDINLNFYLNSMNFSWDEDFNIEKYIFNTPIIIESFKSQSFHYFLVRNENLVQNNQFKDLISTLFKKQLYKYGNLAIYYADY